MRQYDQTRLDSYAWRMRDKLLAPQYAAALVTWDRDIEPVLALHAYHWGDVHDLTYRNEYGEREKLSASGPWVSMSTGGSAACCHHRYDPECEGWVRVREPRWHGAGGCPLDVLR